MVHSHHEYDTAVKRTKEELHELIPGDLQSLSGGKKQTMKQYQCYFLFKREGKIIKCVLIALEKEMATHSSTLAWRIPGTEEPGRPPSLRSHRVGHD